MEAVRNRVLDVALSLKEHGVAGTLDGDFSAEELEKAAKVTQHLHIGSIGQASFVGSMNRSALSMGDVELHQGDFNALRKHLAETLGLTQTDLESLTSAIEKDPAKPARRGRFGKCVANWIATVIRKTSTGAIEVSTDVAAKIMVECLNRYYFGQQ